MFLLIKSVIYKLVHETSFEKNEDDDLREECFRDIVEYVMRYIMEEESIFKLSGLMTKYEDTQNIKALKHLLDGVTWTYI